MKRGRWNWEDVSILGGILAVGAVLRFAGLNWDGGHCFHGDEFVGVLEPAAALSAEDGFRPIFFAYGSLPLYVVRVVGELVGRGGDVLALKMISRALSALASTASIVWVYLIAVCVADCRAGLVAAGFCALAVTLVQAAHFGTVESLLTFWMLGAQYAALLIVRKETWGTYALAGLCIGLGLATKSSAVMLFAPLGAAQVIRVLRDRRGERASVGWTGATLMLAAGIALALALLIDAGESASVRASVLLLVGSMAAAVVALAALMSRRGVSRWAHLVGAVGMAAGVAFVGWPWAVLGFRDQTWAARPMGFLTSMRYEAQVVSGAADVPWTEAFHDAIPFVFELKQMFWWTLGPALGAVGVAGFAWAAWVAVHKSRRWVALLWLIPFVPTLFVRWLLAEVWMYVALPMWVRWVSLALAAAAWGLALWSNRAGGRPSGWGLGEVGRYATGRAPGILVLLAWALPYFLVIGGWKAKFIRYAVPLVPLLCVFGAAMLMAAWRWVRSRGGRVLVGVIAALTLCASALYATAFAGIYLRPNTRDVAARFMRERMEPGSRIVFEQWWDEGLPRLIKEPQERFETNLGALNAKHFGDADEGLLAVHRREVFEIGDGYLVDERKLHYLCEALSGSDCVVLSSNRHYAAILAVPERYPIAALYYRLLFSGSLGYRCIGGAAGYPALFGIAWKDDLAENNFVNFDRPKVLVFENVERLNAAEMRRRFCEPPAEATALTRRAILKTPAEAY